MRQRSLPQQHGAQDDGVPPSPASPPATHTPPWHALSAQAVAQHWSVDPAHGLDDTAVAQRRTAHGPNALPEPPPRPLWRLVARQFVSPLIALLFVAAALAVALGHLNDAAVILAVVVLNAAIGSFQEGRAER